MKPYLYLLFPLFLTACAPNPPPQNPNPPASDVTFYRECEGVPFQRYREQAVELTYEQAVKRNREAAAALEAGAKITEEVDISGEISGGASSETSNEVTGTAIYQSIMSGDEAAVSSAFQQTICTSLAMLDNPNFTQSQKDRLFSSMVDAINARNQWIFAPNRPKE